MNMRLALVRIVLAVTAIVVIQGVAHTALAAPPEGPGVSGLAPADRRLAQDLARAILKRMAATPRPVAGCGPATSESLRAAVSAVIKDSKASTDVTLAAVVLAGQQAPPSDRCLSTALDETRAELDGQGAIQPGITATKGFPLLSGAPAKPRDRAPAPAAAPRPKSAPIVVANPSVPIDRGSAERAQASPKQAIDAEASSPDNIAAKVGEGGNSAKPAAAPQAPQGVIADVSSQVQKLPVVYQPPQFLLLHRPVAFKLVIEALGPGSAKGAFHGDTITGHAQISRTVTATLSAPAGVTITPLSPATQTVTDIANPTWLWDLTAETPNAATLELSIASLVTIDGVDHPVPIEVYNAQIPVQLSVIDRILLWIGQIDPIWKWLIGVITVVGGGIGWALGWRLKLRRGGARPDPA
jgi:hypothetical protein